MSISEQRINELLKAIPGSRKAALGIIFPFNESQPLPNNALKKNERIMGERIDSEFHLRNIYTQEVLEKLLDDEEFFLEFCSLNEIYRLREIKGPHDYLLRLRANSIVDDARAVRLMCQRRNHYESTGRKWSLNHYYHQKDHFHKAYISMLYPAQRKLVKTIPAGLAHIPEANALFMRSIAGDVVIVSERLEMFYYFMSLGFYGEHFGFDWNDKQSALLIAIRIMTGAEAHDFEMDPRVTPSSKAEKGLRNYVDYQMRFTFGHEYSHYLLNHLDEAEVMTYSLGHSNRKRESIATYNHELEYQADYFSIKNIMHNKKEFDSMAHGAFSVLCFLHFIEKCLNKIKSKKLSFSKTHPKSIDRIKQLHYRLGKKSPINDAIIEEMINASEQMLTIVDDAPKLRSDIFTFYGSIHMSKYVKKPPQDRIDY